MLGVYSGRDLSDWLRPPLWSLNEKLVATSISLVETSFVASSTAQRRDLRLASQPQFLP